MGLIDRVGITVDKSYLSINCDYRREILSINEFMKASNVIGLLIGVISFSTACTSTTEEPKAVAVVDKEQIKQEIQAKENEFAGLYNSGEMRNIGYYAEDATTFYPNRPPLRGKAAIVEYLKSGLSSNSNKITFTTNEVFVSNDGNQVLEVGNYRVVDSADAVVNVGNYMSFFEKRNGKYVCVRDMSASEMSPDEKR